MNKGKKTENQRKIRRKDKIKRKEKAIMKGKSKWIRTIKKNEKINWKKQKINEEITLKKYNQRSKII